MEVDENYDDSGDDEKRSTTKQESRKSTPKPVNGNGHGNGNGSANATPANGTAESAA
jgi:hypothetical protein